MLTGFKPPKPGKLIDIKIRLQEGTIDRLRDLADKHEMSVEDYLAAYIEHIVSQSRTHRAPRKKTSRE